MIILLSFSAISSLVPIILIILLIAAAGGLTRGSSFFDLLGFGTLMGFSQGIAKSRLKGLNRKYGGEYKVRHERNKIVSGENAIKSMKKREAERNKINSEVKKRLESQYTSGVLSAPGMATMTGLQRRKYMKYATRLEDIKSKKSTLANYKKNYIDNKKDKSFFGEKTMNKIKDKEFALSVAENAYYFKQFRTRYGNRNANIAIKQAKLDVYRKYGRFNTARRYRNDYGNLASLPLAAIGLAAYEYDSAANMLKYMHKRWNSRANRVNRRMNTNVLAPPGSNIADRGEANPIPGYFANRREGMKRKMNQVFDKILRENRVNTPLIAPSAALAASDAEYNELKKKMKYMNRGIYDWVRGNNASRKELAIGMMRLQFSAKNYARKKKNKNLEYNENDDNTSNSSENESQRAESDNAARGQQEAQREENKAKLEENNSNNG